MNLKRYRTLAINGTQLFFFLLALWRPFMPGFFLGIVIGIGLVTLYDWASELFPRKERM